MINLFENESPDIVKELGSVFLQPQAWLDTPNDALGGRVPRELIDTSDEDLLRDFVRRIKHGMFS